MMIRTGYQPAVTPPATVFPKQHPVHVIARRVAFEMGVPFADLQGPRRLKPMCRARFAAIWIARRITKLSLPQIGRQLGGRDHSTILNAIARADDLRARDPAFRAITDSIMRELSDADQEEFDEARL